MKLRDYQENLSSEACDILKRKHLVVLSMQVRTGKSLTALETCKKYAAKKVLFITKIKAFSSIEQDYTNFGYTFDLTIINRESLHKIENNDFDVVIVDEVHGYSSYPKPSKYQKDVKKRFGNKPLIFLSGTLTPESYSQFYHIFQISNHHYFSTNYKNFYAWAKEFVNIKERNLGYAIVRDYSDADKIKFWSFIRHYILTYTQEQAGFTSKVNEMTLYVEMKPITYQLIERLKKDLVVTSSKTGRSIVADTAVKLQQKIHQLSSGTIKFEDGIYHIIDNSKALYIQENFSDKKIAIFYNFVAELEMLRQTFGQKLTTDLDEFNNSDKWIALQIVSGREGISLAKADCLVMLNIQFSAVSYFQSIDRLTTKDRKENNVFWIFSNQGIERQIYKAVSNKKDFTTQIFLKENGISITNKKTIRETWL